MVGKKLMKKACASICAAAVMMTTLAADPLTGYAVEFNLSQEMGYYSGTDGAYGYCIPIEWYDAGNRECILNLYGGPDAKASAIKLPKTVTDEKGTVYAVTTIGSDFTSLLTFFGTAWGMEVNSLTSVTIPYGYKHIESMADGRMGAFQNQTQLTKVVIPESVTDIGDAVFEGSDGVKIYAPYGSAAQKYAETHKIPYKNNVAMNHKVLTLSKGRKTKLKLKNTKKKITWKSSNSQVAAVSKGKVTAKKAGTATITAKTAGKTYRCTVTVK